MKALLSAIGAIHIAKTPRKADYWGAAAIVALSLLLLAMLVLDKVMR